MPDRGPTGGGQITCLGTIAADALRDVSAGRVAAVFERSFYIAVADAWLCFGPEALGLGPLNVVCALRDGRDWRALDVRLGSAVRVTPTQVRIAPGLTLARAGARFWTPPSPGDWTPASLATGLDALEDRIPAMLPDDGLGALALRDVPPRHRTTLVRSALESLHRVVPALPELLATGRPSPALVPALRPLIGLGPGLTPSGDDVLGGLLLTLHLLGRGETGRSLFAGLQSQLRSDTNPISIAHIRAAAAGAGSAALHETLNAVLTGDQAAMADGLRRLDSLGHTSGWDSLAGAVLMLRACANITPARRARPSPAVAGIAALSV